MVRRADGDRLVPDMGWGMVVTCGLDHTLLGGVDSASSSTRLQPEIEYGLMGRIGMLPARLVGYGEGWHGDECVLWAEGVVRQAAVFAEALELRRRIEVTVGALPFASLTGRERRLRPGDPHVLVPRQRRLPGPRRGPTS